MENSKIIPITVGVLGVGIFLFAVSKSSNNSNAQVYLDEQTNSDSFNSKEVVNSLILAMNKLGTDEDGIIKALTNVTQTQFGLINQVFGYRNYNSITGNSYFAIWQTPVKKNLKFWLRSELSDYWYNLLKSKYPKYL